MEKGYHIRPCTLEDIPAVEALIPLSVHGLQGSHYSEEQMAGALGTVFGVDAQLIHDGTYFVAAAGDLIVGCGGWSKRKTLFGSDRLRQEADPLLEPGRDAARIRAFFVHPAWARRGIGSEIMRRAEQAAYQAGFQRIEIGATLPGEALYAKFGYTVVERYEVPLPNGRQLPILRMAKAGIGVG